MKTKASTIMKMAASQNPDLELTRFGKFLVWTTKWEFDTTSYFMGVFASAIGGAILRSIW